MLAGHRDGKGTCVPGTLSSTYEYTQLAKGVALGGGGVAQFVTDFASYDDVPYDTSIRSPRWLLLPGLLQWRQNLSRGALTGMWPAEFLGKFWPI